MKMNKFIDPTLVRLALLLLILTVIYWLLYQSTAESTIPAFVLTFSLLLFEFIWLILVANFINKRFLPVNLLASILLAVIFYFVVGYVWATAKLFYNPNVLSLSTISVFWPYELFVRGAVHFFAKF